MDTYGGVLYVDYTVQVDKYGGILVGGYVLVVLTYLLYAWLRRSRPSLGQAAVSTGAKFRLAAVRGDVAMMAAIQKFSRDHSKIFDVDMSRNGFTALLAACSVAKVESVLWLCEQGANVNKVEKAGRRYSPLHYAARGGSKDCIEILLLYGANPMAHTASGRTPADLATKHGHAREAAFINEMILKTPRNSDDIERRRQRLDRLRKKFLGQGTSAAVQAKDHVATYLARARDGIGSEGTVTSPGMSWIRLIAFLNATITVCYLLWRALRSLHTGWWYFYSMTVWLAEAIEVTFTMVLLYLSCFQIDREDRDLVNMLDAVRYPRVDVLVCYRGKQDKEDARERDHNSKSNRREVHPTEYRQIDIEDFNGTKGVSAMTRSSDGDDATTVSTAVDSLEATVTSVLNLDYPGSKIRIFVLDESRDAQVERMLRVVEFKAKYMGRKVEFHTMASSAGSALVHQSSSQTDFALIIHDDMILDPMFLRKTLGHFYQRDPSSPEGQGMWVKKEHAAMLQVPCEFWNATRDTLTYASRASHGWLMRGMDGVSACPCWGTGTLFQRDIMISMAGKSAVRRCSDMCPVSNNIRTSMDILESGYSSMVLNRRLLYCTAPEGLHNMFRQRLRCGMSLFRTLLDDNPLRRKGLSLTQALALWETCGHPMGAICTVYLALVPAVYVLSGGSPVVLHNSWEFVVAFGSYYVCSRLTLWWTHRGHISELWRHIQSSVWISPWYVAGVFCTFMNKMSTLVGNKQKCMGVRSWACLRSPEKRPSGGKADATEGQTAEPALLDRHIAERLRRTSIDLLIIAPHLIYYCTGVAAAVYFVIKAARGDLSTWELLLHMAALCWIGMVCLCCWPPIRAALPHHPSAGSWVTTWFPAVNRRLFSLRARRDVEARETTRKVFIRGQRSSTIVDMADGGKIDDLTDNVVVAFNPADKLVAPESCTTPFPSMMEGEGGNACFGRKGSVEILSPFAMATCLSDIHTSYTMEHPDQADPPGLPGQSGRSGQSGQTSQNGQSTQQSRGGIPRAEKSKSLDPPSWIRKPFAHPRPTSANLSNLDGWREPVRNPTMEHANQPPDDVLRNGTSRRMKSSALSQGSCTLGRPPRSRTVRTRSGTSINIDALTKNPVMGVKLASHDFTSTKGNQSSLVTPFANVPAPSQTMASWSSRGGLRTAQPLALLSTMLPRMNTASVSAASGKVLEYSGGVPHPIDDIGMACFLVLNVVGMCLLVAASVLASSFLRV